MINNNQIIDFFEGRKQFILESKKKDKGEIIIEDTSTKISNVFSFLTIGEKELQQHLLEVHFKSRILYTHYLDQSNYLLRTSFNKEHSLIIDILDIESYYINFNVENLYDYFLSIKEQVNIIIKESHIGVRPFVFLEYNIGLMYMEFLLGRDIKHRIDEDEYGELNIVFQTFFELYNRMFIKNSTLGKPDIVDLENEITIVNKKPLILGKSFGDDLF